jgi:hypothetical protein
MRAIILGSRRVMNRTAIHHAIMDNGLKNKVNEILTMGYFGTAKVLELYALSQKIKFSRYVRPQKMYANADAIILLNDPDCTRTKELLSYAPKIPIYKITPTVIEKLNDFKKFMIRDPIPVPKWDEDIIYEEEDDDSQENNDLSDWLEDDLFTDDETDFYSDDYFSDSEDDVDT